MKKVLIVALFMVAGCKATPGRDEEAKQNNVPTSNVIAYTGTYLVTKICDEGRAIYSVDSQSSSLQVIPDAAECKEPADKPEAVK